MSELKKGDRVTVVLEKRPPVHGIIVGEGRTKQWWLILKDGTKHSIGYHKDFCHPEVNHETNTGKAPQ